MAIDFYPDYQEISAITNSKNAVITTISNHGYIVGQCFRVSVPTIFGMTQINGSIATVLGVPALNQIITNINSTNFDPFVIPVTVTTPALTIPVGETARDPWANSLDDATKNIT